MRTVVEFYGQKDVGRPMIAQHEVKVLPRDHMPETVVPSRLSARDEIGESDLEGDEVVAADCHS